MKLFKRYLPYFVVIISLAAYCFVYSSTASRTVVDNPQLYSNPVECLNPTVPMMYSNPISLPLRYLGTGSVASTAEDVNLSGITTSRTVLVHYKSYLKKSARLSNDARRAVYSQIVDSLQTVFRFINGSACQHLDVSPPHLV